MNTAVDVDHQPKRACRTRKKKDQAKKKGKNGKLDPRFRSGDILKSKIDSLRDLPRKLGYHPGGRIQTRKLPETDGSGIG